MKKYNEHIQKEEPEEKLEFSGKSGFDIFLKLINEFEYIFLKHKYLNTSNFSYFFATDRITKKDEILDILKRKKSLKTAYKTLEKIKDKRLSFYFGIREYKCQYGFYDVDENMVYKVGVFNINTQYFKKLFKYKCLKPIKDVSLRASLKNLKLLNQIKIDFKDLFKKTPSDIEIIDEERIKKTYKPEVFKPEDLEEMKLTSNFEIWARSYSWKNKCRYYVVLNEEYVHFYIKIKQ